jgi:signal transduction histidine kinase
MTLRWTDVALPALIATVGVVELASLDLDGRVAAGVVLIGSCALLVLRRRWPLVTCTLAAVGPAALPFVGPAYDEVATGILVVAVSMYSLARWIASHLGLVGMALLLGALLAGYTLEDLRDHGLDDVVFVLALVVPPYVLGRVARMLAVQAEQLRDREELVKQAAVRDERDRIARELHDVIAHSLSAMVVQVAAARDLVRQQPERAEHTLDRVAQTGRTAIAETGRLLHVLRDADDELGLAPTPGVADLAALVEDFRRDGLDTTLVVDGVDGMALPAAVDVSAYRIVREGLTNALRYSTDRVARVEVLGTSEGVTIRVLNRSEGRTGLGSGLGLAGLAERIDLLGGTLRHGPSPDGWELVARLPLAAGSDRLDPRGTELV